MDNKAFDCKECAWFLKSGVACKKGISISGHLTSFCPSYTWFREYIFELEQENKKMKDALEGIKERACYEGGGVATDIAEEALKEGK